MKEKLLIAFEVPYEIVDGGAHVDFPPYVRVAPEVFSSINTALTQHGLELKHINITAQHRAEIEEQQKAAQLTHVQLMETRNDVPATPGAEAGT